MNLLASILRTLVPLVVGWVVTITGAIGIEVDSTAVAGGVTAAVTAVYYLLLRLAEQAAERLQWEPLRLVAGVLLGWARPPQYKQPSPAGTVQVHLDAEAFGQDLHEIIRRNIRLGGSR
ncbi:hypothetical protein QMZ92_13095 [Streptomyces sp. HNM0645]|uniref:hypothetical protein n=1 Tax=Streptomyces sp. HNM0645 TaxID=2782343 RepID=UPI0024B7060C|nr:hypothetical protein [Streptomyces sp. HNM0645]MDI9885303.1 hypothetical protein [Streptomyces sp. HNM0645]